MKTTCIIPLTNPLRFVSDEQAQQLPQRILQLRKAAGLTQNDMAQALGITHGRYGHYERGFRRIPISFLPQIAETLGCSEADLFGSDQTSQRKRGPASRADQLVERLNKLPRTKQALILDIFEGALDRTS